MASLPDQKNASSDTVRQHENPASLQESSTVTRSISTRTTILTTYLNGDIPAFPNVAKHVRPATLNKHKQKDEDGNAVEQPDRKQQKTKTIVDEEMRGLEASVQAQGFASEVLEAIDGVKREPDQNTHSDEAVTQSHYDLTYDQLRKIKATVLDEQFTESAEADTHGRFGIARTLSDKQITWWNQKWNKRWIPSVFRRAVDEFHLLLYIFDVGEQLSEDMNDPSKQVFEYRRHMYLQGRDARLWLDIYNEMNLRCSYLRTDDTIQLDEEDRILADYTLAVELLRRRNYQRQEWDDHVQVVKEEIQQKIRENLWSGPAASASQESRFTPVPLDEQEARLFNAADEIASQEEPELEYEYHRRRERAGDEPRRTQEDWKEFNFDAFVSNADVLDGETHDPGRFDPIEEGYRQEYGTDIWAMESLPDVG